MRPFLPCRRENDPHVIPGREHERTFSGGASYHHKKGSRTDEDASEKGSCGESLMEKYECQNEGDDYAQFVHRDDL